MFDQLRRRAIYKLASLGPRYMPFADVATPDLPLSRLLRLSLFQVSVGMTLVLLVGTLNRVMIVELNVPAAIVSVMIALPVLFAPFRALIGHKSDTHRCELGWRRVPFVWKGTTYQFGGFAIMPFALLVLGDAGQAHLAPDWIGLVSAALAFLLVGAGAHVVQTAGLALATDLTPPESHPKVVGLMYVALLLGMMGSALLFGAMLEDFTPGRLVQVIQGAAVMCVLLNGIALWKQETRNPPRGVVRAPDPTFRDSWALFCSSDHAIRRLVIIGLGTMAFGMADVLLEPFGGEVLAWSVSATTKLTALLAVGGLVGFVFASGVLARGGNTYRLARDAALVGIPAFVLVIVAAPSGQAIAFLAGNFLIGFGAAVFGHATLTATMRAAPRSQAGLALGAWGAVQATAAGVAVGLGGVLRDGIDLLLNSWSVLNPLVGPASGYLVVYGLEIALLIAAVIALSPILRRISQRPRAPRGTGVDARSPAQDDRSLADLAGR